MKWLNTVCLTALLGSALARTAAAQGPKKARDDEAPVPASESLEAWPWRQELTVPPPNPPPPVGGGQGGGELFEFTVPPGVFDKARPNLSDLRIADANGKRVPYALRVRRTELQQVPVKGQRPFNRTTNAAGKYAELSLALEDEGPIIHNEIEVNTTGNNFRRAVQVYGGDTDRLEKAAEIADKYIVRYVIKGKDDKEKVIVDLRKVSYDLSRYPYLKVRVHADPSSKEETPSIESVIARRTTEVKGVDQTLPIQLGQREDVPGEGGPGSAWIIELPGRENVPWERLNFDVMEVAFVRPYRLEVANPDEPRQVIARGDWRRGTASQRPGGERRPLEIELPAGVSARRLRLVVTDFSNPPLTMTGARSILAARQVVFELPREKQHALPLRLYFGNPQATPPHYDFARTLPARAPQQPAQASLSGPVERNPEYQAPPLPLSERWPWLIYLVLGAASLVLLGVLAVLARQVMARHDAGQAAV
jgi:hypothetical protein